MKLPILLLIVSIVLLTTCHPRRIYYDSQDDRSAVLGDGTPGSLERTDAFSLVTQVSSPIAQVLDVVIGIRNNSEILIRYDASTLAVAWPAATISGSNLYVNGRKTSGDRVFEIKADGTLDILYKVWSDEAEMAPDTVIVLPGAILWRDYEVVIDSVKYVLPNTDKTGG